MTSATYEFAFTHVASARIDIARWVDAVLAQFADASIAPALVATKGKLVPAPKDPAAMRYRLGSSATPTVIGGRDPDYPSASDGWALYASADAEQGQLIFARHFAGGSTPSTLAAWLSGATDLAIAARAPGYGYAYAGRFPKDLSFGLGMHEGKYGPPLDAFARDPAIDNWSRAAMWNTWPAYLRDVFFANVLTPSLRREVGDVLDAGRVSNLSDDLTLWTFEDEAARATAAHALAQRGLLVARHAPDSQSQRRAAK